MTKNTSKYDWVTVDMIYDSMERLRTSTATYNDSEWKEFVASISQEQICESVEKFSRKGWNAE